MVGGVKAGNVVVVEVEEEADELKDETGLPPNENAPAERVGSEGREGFDAVDDSIDIGFPPNEKLPAGVGSEGGLAASSVESISFRSRV